MSEDMDMVDVLHAAEDRVVQLEGLLTRFVDQVATQPYLDDTLVNDIRAAIEPPYCRESCSDDSGLIHDEDCGCPCHWARGGDD